MSGYMTGWPAYCCPRGGIPPSAPLAQGADTRGRAGRGGAVEPGGGMASMPPSGDIHMLEPVKKKAVKNKSHKKRKQILYTPGRPG